MSKIKLTKNDLKKQKDELKMFKRYLPTLQLKKQQLYMEIVRIENSYKNKNLEQQKLKGSISNWISLFSEEFPFESWIQVKTVVKKSVNIAGVAIPIFDSIEYEDIRHDLLFTPYWVDKGIEILKIVIQIDVELKILKKQIDLLLREFRVTSQRVNLFEKVMIPTAKANIKKINIYLGDQQTAAVVRGKIAKSNLIDKKNRNKLMIVKMKKVLLLTLSKYKKESLEILRDFGAVHINSCNKNSDSLKKSIDNRRILMQAFSLLREDGGVKALKSSNGNFLDIAKSIVNLGNEIKEFQDIKRSLLHERNLISVWGNFSLEYIDKLKESNIYIQFFKIQKSEYKNLLRDPNVNVLLIKNVKNISYFVSVGEFEQKIEIADEFKFNFDLNYINNKLKVVDEILDQKLTQISLFNKYIDILRDEIKNYDQIVEFEQVLADMQTDFDDFSYVTGFVPVESQESLKSSVLKAGFAVQFADPEENDIIPTYIKRKGIANLAAPIFNILETIPGYKERDISFIFMLFFFVFLV